MSGYAESTSKVTRCGVFQCRGGDEVVVSEESGQVDWKTLRSCLVLLYRSSLWRRGCKESAQMGVSSQIRRRIECHEDSTSELSYIEPPYKLLEIYGPEQIIQTSVREQVPRPEQKNC